MPSLQRDGALYVSSERTFVTQNKKSHEKPLLHFKLSEKDLRKVNMKITENNAKSTLL